MRGRPISFQNSLNFYTTEDLAYHKMLLSLWAANCFPLHYMLFLFLLYISWYNKLNKSKNHHNSFVYHFLSVKWNFAFTFSNSGLAKTWLTVPFAMALHACALSGLSDFYTVSYLHSYMWLDLWKLSLLAQEMKFNILLIIKPTVLHYLKIPST